MNCSCQQHMFETDRAIAMWQQGASTNVHGYAASLERCHVCTNLLDVGLLQSGMKPRCSAGAREAGLCSHSLQESMHAFTVVQRSTDTPFPHQRMYPATNPQLCRVAAQTAW
jgi:hypothetical protein